MTYAICIKCGAEKVGALTWCLKCKFDPISPEDAARSIMFSDQILSKSDLEAAAARIKSGEGVTFDPASVAQLAAVVPVAMARCKRIVWVVGLVVGAVVIGAVVVYLVL